MEGNLAACQLLVNEGGADLGAKDRWGNTAVDEAKRVGSVQVRAFLEQAARAPRQQIAPDSD